MYLIKPGKLYDFMGMRKYFLVLSAFLLIASAISFFVPGPKWGTDFKGGTEIVVQFKEHVEPGALRKAVEDIRGPDGSVQFGSAEVVAVPEKQDTFLIRVQEVSAVTDSVKRAFNEGMCFGDTIADDCMVDGKPNPDIVPTEVKFSPGGEKITLRYDWNVEKLDSKEKDEHDKTERDRKLDELVSSIEQRVSTISGISLEEKNVVSLVSAREGDSRVEVHLKAKGTQLMDGIKKAFPTQAPDAPISDTWIGPKAGSELRDSAFKSIGIAIFFIMAYIAIRFDLRFAPGAIVALIHDVGISIGAMCLTRKEISLSTVAAILTILGYSLTDTVIVYDRIRENLGRHRGMTFSQIVNLSVSEMFGRTIITSSTAAVSMLMFLFFGTQVIKDFAFVMLVGIAVGTYSSIYIAAPTTEWVDRMFFARRTPKTSKDVRTRRGKRADAVV